MMGDETVGAVTHTHTHTQVSNNKKKIYRRNDNGVTLIALVITIIILLILASVSITTLFGQDGIITRAQDAARKTAEAAQNEQEFLNYATDYLNNYLSGTTGGEKTLAEKMVDAGITGDPESLKDVVDGVPIPKGFIVSTVEEEKTKAGGLVIIDDVTSSEFVWVPVDDLAEDGYRDETNNAVKFGRRTFGRSDSLGGTTQVVSEWTENIEGNDPQLIQSVREYRGFYIARYEASYENGNVVSKKSTTIGSLINNVSKSEAETECVNMYASDAKVVGHLPYGAEWDSTLQWFKQTAPGFNNEDTLIGSDSKSWGNYSGVLMNTGAITVPANRHMVNNIYDMAGNLWEYTQEAYDTGIPPVVRGGWMMAAYRQAYAESLSGADEIGFRVALYIK